MDLHRQFYKVSEETFVTVADGRSYTLVATNIRIPIRLWHKETDCTVEISDDADIVSDKVIWRASDHKLLCPCGLPTSGTWTFVYGPDVEDIADNVTPALLHKRMHYLIAYQAALLKSIIESSKRVNGFATIVAEGISNNLAMVNDSGPRYVTRTSES